MYLIPQMVQPPAFKIFECVLKSYFLQIPQNTTALKKKKSIMNFPVFFSPFWVHERVFVAEMLQCYIKLFYVKKEKSKDDVIIE